MANGFPVIAADAHAVETERTRELLGSGYLPVSY
jgi:hypothetical protein